MNYLNVKRITIIYFKYTIKELCCIIKVNIIDTNRNLNSIGFNCFVIAIFAISLSVLFTVIVEKTILPLDTL